MRLSPLAISTAALALAMAAPVVGQDAMSSAAMPAGEPMMMSGKTITITVENLLTGQPFSPSFFESRTADSPPLYGLGETASDALAAVAEGGNTGMFSVAAAMNEGSVLGDAALAIHTLPGQTRTVTIHVDEAHPLLDGVWMLGRTNDGFSGFSGVDAFALTEPLVLDVPGYDAGSEINSEKKGFLGALGGGNMREPEDGVVTEHAGIRGDADAPAEWNWDVATPVARVTFTPVTAAM